MSRNVPDFNSIFAKRLGELLDGEHVGKKTTQQELAKEIGVTRQTVSEYRGATSIPNADKLRGIAEHFDVSADFLLGITGDPSKDRDLQAVFNEVGLTSKSMSNLQQYENDSIELSILNYMVENTYLHNLLAELKNALIETVTFSLLRGDADIFYDSFESNVYQRMKKWELNKTITRTLEILYGNFAQDHRHTLEIPAQKILDETTTADFEAYVQREFISKLHEDEITAELEEELDNILNDNEKGESKNTVEGLQELSAEELNSYDRFEEDEEQ